MSQQQGEKPAKGAKSNATRKPRKIREQQDTAQPISQVSTVHITRATTAQGNTRKEKKKELAREQPVEAPIATPEERARKTREDYLKSKSNYSGNKLEALLYLTDNLAKVETLPKETLQKI